MQTRLLIIMGWFALTAVCLALGACAILNQPRFGKLPQGERLKGIAQSPNYKDGKFQNPLPTPLFSQDDSLLSVMWNNQVNKSERLAPDEPLPFIKTDLKELDRQEDMVIWLGHSSWFIQFGGKRLLIDPVFSNYAAPFSLFNKAYAGSTIYTAEDMPEIDILFISHDHWDHLDYPTVMALKTKVKQVICPLGVGTYFQYWGYFKEQVHEGDWFDKVAIGPDFTVHLLPARHYSSRLLAKNKTLWAGFALEFSGRSIFFSGDTGYGPHFSEIGKLFQGIDLVILDCGQYDSKWSLIHMTPEEASQAAADLGARTLIPSHIGRFTIANHPWDEPFKRVTEASRNKSYRLVTPKMGEPVAPDDPTSQFPGWWNQPDVI